MTNINSLVGGIGLLACIGAIILVAVVAILFRAFTRPKATPINHNAEGPRSDYLSNENPGGFGGVPTTGAPRENDLPPSEAPSGGAQIYGDDDH